MHLLVTSAAGANGNGYGSLLAFDLDGRPEPLDDQDNLGEWAALAKAIQKFVLSFQLTPGFPARCPRMTCSTNPSPNRLVNGTGLNKRR